MNEKFSLEALKEEIFHELTFKYSKLFRDVTYLHDDALVHLEISRGFDGWLAIRGTGSTIPKSSGEYFFLDIGVKLHSETPAETRKIISKNHVNKNLEKWTKQAYEYFNA